jgi:hypothetical protein
MAEKKERQDDKAGKGASKQSGSKPKKTAAKKSRAAKPGAGKEKGAADIKQDQAVKEEGASPAGGETTGAPSDTAREKEDLGKRAAAGEKPAAGAAREEELSDEELQRLVEESLEKVTVEDIVLNMMGQLASVGYLKMGLPESVNLKYRDLNQAQLAIDTLEAMLKGAEGKVGAETLKPFQGTLANLQMNYVQLKARVGGT